MYRVRLLARAHGKSLQVLMRISLALLSNHAKSTQPSYWNMAILDSQGEIVPKEPPNPEKSQILEGTNESVRSRNI